MHPVADVRLGLGEELFGIERVQAIDGSGARPWNRTATIARGREWTEAG